MTGGDGNEISSGAGGALGEGDFSYVALCGGIGGAKLALGLARYLKAGELTIIVNTGDDFEHLGLHISPDIDTVLYTLAGLANPETGWGLADETWRFMSALERLGGATWFRLSDGDLAMHVDRTARLREGATLSEITDRTRRCFGLGFKIVPMSDQPVRTTVVTNAGELPFQDYFVRQQCRPRVERIIYQGAGESRLAPGAKAALVAPNLGGIIVCPSNPWLSIEPILSLPEAREMLRASGAPVVAVSPLIGGKAVKGPTAKIMMELGLQPGIKAVAEHYRGLIDGLIVDRQDEPLDGEIAMPTYVTNTLMRTLEDRISLAADCIAFFQALRNVEPALSEAGS